MAYEISGKVKLVGDVQTFASGFSKRELVVTTEEQYPQDVALEALKEKADLLTNLKPGDPVKVYFNISGREYNGRHFVNLTIWKIEEGAGSGGGAKAGPGKRKTAEPEPEDTTDYSVDIETDPF